MTSTESTGLQVEWATESTGALGQWQLDMLMAENEHKLDTAKFHKRMTKWLKRNLSADEDKVSEKLIQTALENVKMEEAGWTYLAARELKNMIYREARKNRGYEGDAYSEGTLYGLIQMLSQPTANQSIPVYKSELLELYSEEEINTINSFLDGTKDTLFSYIGLFLLTDRYLARPQKGMIYELPQERFIIIAMDLMRQEDKSVRLEKIKEAYWAMSNLYMTVATPTLANAGKTHGQLSSCFIDFADDSIDGIYFANRDTAKVSKYGGGVGVYFGKVRAMGSAIRGHVGASSGPIPFLKLFNQTAVSVDQLGMRAGAIAVYQDVWNISIMDFLDLKQSNGDERTRAEDLFTGVCIPDLFMEKLDEIDETGRSIGEWYTFDPHTVEQTLGFCLEDFYDEENGPESNGEFRKHYNIAVEAAKDGILPKYAFKAQRAMDIHKRIMEVQLEHGTPYMFYRDTVNRANPNKHVKGVGKTAIYCSNLCTEIMQNMSPTTVSEEYYDEKRGKIITERDAGDYVVCNLSSINLPRAVRDNVLERLIPIQMRMLDNVIDVNTLPVVQAMATNKKYRPVGLGTFGWHHLLADKGILWDSEEAVTYADTLYEKIAFLTIQASMTLSKERGAYELFEGSEWQNGDYFKSRKYFEEGPMQAEWIELSAEVAVHGMRNAYVMAVAPNSSTAKVGDSTDGIDPVYALEFVEEKKNFKFNVTAPGLTLDNYMAYQKTRYEVSQLASIRQNAARQRHVDQGISFNFYVTKDIKAKEMHQLHHEAWKQGLKTTYYVRSTAAGDIKTCEWCHS